MQEVLRNRLIYGSMCFMLLFVLLWLDRQIEVWTSNPPWVHTGHGDYGLAGVGVFIFMMIALPLGTIELVRMLSTDQIVPYKSIAIAGTTLLCLHAFLTQFEWFKPIAASTLEFIVVFGMLAAALRQAWRREVQDAMRHMAGTVLAVLYLGGLAWFLLALRVKHSLDPNRYQGSTAAVLMILLVVKSTDIGAYFGGRKLGRHKLIPWLSPGKTWEGLACGLLMSGIVAILCTLVWPNKLHTLKPFYKAFTVGVIVGGIGQAGDLLESLMKRDAEVKDSGRLIPGIGGVLDIIDSPLLACPIAYILFSLV